MKGVAPIDQVTPSLFIISIDSSGWNSCCSTTRAPNKRGVMRPWLNPVAWLRGAGINMTSSRVRCRDLIKVFSEKIKALWEINTAFGRPVVPEVERIRTISSELLSGASFNGSNVSKISFKVIVPWDSTVLSWTQKAPSSRLVISSLTERNWSSKLVLWWKVGQMKAFDSTRFME